MPERAVASVFETKGQNGLAAIKDMPYRLIFKTIKNAVNQKFTAFY